MSPAADAPDAAGEAAPKPVQILPRMPLTLVGDAGAACEGDACAL